MNLYTGFSSPVKSLLVLFEDRVHPQEPLNFPIHYMHKRFHVGAAISMLVVLLLLPLSSEMDDSKFDHSGGRGGGGGPATAAAAAVAVAAMDDNWQQKRLATRALTVA
jgi:hypothetical protein